MPDLLPRTPLEGKGRWRDQRRRYPGYDSAKKAYTFNAFDSMGMMGAGTMTVSGNTWTATGTGNMGGQVIHDRCTLAFGAGSTTLTIKCEMSADGKSWAPSFEGKATKGK